MKIENKSVTLSQKLSTALNRLPNPSQVLKSKSATMEIFHKVARQADIFPQIDSYQSSLHNLQLSVQADNKSVADFFTGYFGTVGFHQLIPLAASARDYGFAVIEATRYGQYEGRTVPLQLELCPPEYFFFDRDRALRMNVQGNNSGIDVFKEHPGKFLLVQHRNTLLNPYGVGLLDIAYWLAVGLNGNFEFLMQFCEDDGRDRWIGYYPKESPQKDIDDLLTSLIQGRNNSVTAMPDGMRVELKEATGRGSSTELYTSADEMLRRKVEKIWTGTDLTMQVDGKGGYSSSENGLAIREEALLAGISLVQSAAVQLVQIVCYLNNLPEVPRISLTLPKTINKAIAETDQIYYGMGLRPTRELFLKRGYCEDDFFIDPATGTAATGGQSADFAALPEDFDPLVDAFEAYRERIKKKGR